MLPRLARAELQEGGLVLWDLRLYIYVILEWRESDMSEGVISIPSLNRPRSRNYCLTSLIATSIGEAM